MQYVSKLLSAFFIFIALSFVSVMHSQHDTTNQFADLNWISAPNTVNIAERAKIKLSGDLLYLDSAETIKFLELNGNPPSENNFTIADGKESWFAVFEFTAGGYVKDDEEIDADALLKDLKDNNKKGLEERQRQGLPLLYLDGWYIPPRYDQKTRRLEWATKLRDQQDNTIINFTIRILGRSGYMSVMLVSEPQTLDRDIKSFKNALKDFDYVAGERYSEWKKGDKVAAYGLGALVVGGVAASVASKKGGLKLLLAIAIAAIAALKTFFKKIFGKK